MSGGNISQLTAEIVDHPVTVDTQQVGDVGGVLRVLRLDVRLGLLANTNKGLGHLSHVHHTGRVLANRILELSSSESLEGSPLLF